MNRKWTCGALRIMRSLLLRLSSLGLVLLPVALIVVCVERYAEQAEISRAATAAASREMFLQVRPADCGMSVEQVKAAFSRMGYGEASVIRTPYGGLTLRTPAFGTLREVGDALAEARTVLPTVRAVNCCPVADWRAEVFVLDKRNTGDEDTRETTVANAENVMMEMRESLEQLAARDGHLGALPYNWEQNTYYEPITTRLYIGAEPLYMTTIRNEFRDYLCNPEAE